MYVCMYTHISYNANTRQQHTSPRIAGGLHIHIRKYKHTYMHAYIHIHGGGMSRTATGRDIDVKGSIVSDPLVHLSHLQSK